MPTTARGSLSLPVRHPSVARSSASCSADGQRVPQDIPKWHCRTSPTVPLVRNGPLNTACRTLIEESSGCEDDQAALQGAENRSCLAQVMRSGTVGLEAVREGSNTGESPQHQATHDRTDHGLATLAQPLVVPKLILLL